MTKEEAQEYPEGQVFELWHWDYNENKPKLTPFKRYQLSFQYDNEWEAHVYSKAYYSVDKSLSSVIDYQVKLREEEIIKLKNQIARIKGYMKV